MTTTENADALSFASHSNADGLHVWELAGQRGGISFSCWPDETTNLPDHAVIIRHSHAPLSATPFSPEPACHLTGGRCFTDADGHTGRVLLERWLMAERDDEVVLAELRDWYADLPEEAR